MNKTIIRAEGDSLLLRNKKIPAYQERNLQITEVVEKDSGYIEFSLSSEEPYERWFGTEILRHSEDAVNLSRINGGNAAFLFNHNRDDYIGALKKGWLENGKLRVSAQFELDNEDNPLARKIHKSVCNGTLKSVSVGYSYDEIIFEERGGEDYVIATRWTPHEGSIVTITADTTVGIGRSSEVETRYIASLQRENLKEEESGCKAVSPEPNLVKTEDTTMAVATPTKEEILSQERERSQSLIAAGKKYNCPELAEKAIDEGWTIQQFRSHILDALPSQKPVARTTDPLGMSNNEQKRYSITRAITAALEGDWGENCFEKEVHDELVKRAKKTRNYKETGNVLIPAFDLGVNNRAAGEGRDAIYRISTMQRDQQVGDPLFGGNLVETELLSERFIDIFRNSSIMRRMGMTSLTGLMGNVDIPKQTAGVTDGSSIYWVPEDTDVSQIDAEFGLVKLRPKNAGSFMYVTRNMLLQSSISMDAFIRRELAIALALGMDRAAIEGTGINDEPLGILNTPGVNPIVFGANGDVPTWEKLVQFETKIATANADERTMGWAVNAKLRGELKSRQKFAGTTGETLWQSGMNGKNEGYINGYRAYVSNQIPGNLTKGTGTNLNATIFGDFSRLICAEWGTYELAADPYHRFLAGGVRVRIIHTCDIAATQEKAFSVATDISTPFSN